MLHCIVWEKPLTIHYFVVKLVNKTVYNIFNLLKFERMDVFKEYDFVKRIECFESYLKIHYRTCKLDRFSPKVEQLICFMFFKASSFCQYCHIWEIFGFGWEIFLAFRITVYFKSNQISILKVLVTYLGSI